MQCTIRDVQSHNSHLTTLQPIPKTRFTDPTSTTVSHRHHMRPTSAHSTSIQPKPRIHLIRRFRALIMRSISSVICLTWSDPWPDTSLVTRTALSPPSKIRGIRSESTVDCKVDICLVSCWIALLRKVSRVDCKALVEASRSLTNMRAAKTCSCVRGTGYNFMFVKAAARTRNSGGGFRVAWARRTISFALTPEQRNNARTRAMSACVMMSALVYLSMV